MPDYSATSLGDDQAALWAFIGRSLVNAEGTPVTVKDTGGHYLFANAAFQALAPGYAPGKTDGQLFGPAEAQALAVEDAQCLDAAAPRIAEERIGARVFMALRLAAGARLTTLRVEITRKSRDEQDLLASRALFKGILDIASDAVVTIDETQCITLFNQGAERIFGYSADEAIGQKLDILLPPTARNVHHRHLEHFGHSATVARQMGERGTIFGRRKDGSVFPAEASISRLVIDGRPSFTAILRDVTRQREADEAIRRLAADLQHRAAQLEAANRELEAFSYSVSHDLRQPLRGIDGFSQVLLEDYLDQLDEEGRDLLSRIRAASQRMAQLIDDILNLSRLSRVDIHRRPVDLTAMAIGILDELAKSEPDRDVAVTVADGLAAEADPHLVRIVLVNLLGNAWKYTGKTEAAAIEVGAVDDPERGRVFFVRDNGAGFDMAYVGKLFGAFQRLHAAEEYPGTGVGLATVQRIVHKHGGTTWAEGALGQGATFHFTLT